MKIVTVQEMLAIERAANAAGHSYGEMMAHAGRGLAEIVESEYGAKTDRSLVALVGKGNNGGDALVALVHLAGWGWTGRFITIDRPEDDLARRAQEAGWERLDWQAPGSAGLAEQIARAAVILDGVLGTGIRLPLRPPASEALGDIKNALTPDHRVVAVDLPSGVDADSGEAADETLPAETTVTMAAAKTGFYHFPAAGYLGTIRLSGIGLPDRLPEWERIRRLVLDAEQVSGWLPERPPDAHKGTFGTVWIAAGSRRYPGAALLAARAAFRSGAGLVSTAVPETVYQLLAGHFPESTWLPLPEEDGAFTGAAASALIDVLQRATALLFGPGFGLAVSTRTFIAGLLDGAAKLPPLVIDADGLKLLAQIDGWPQRLRPNTILTPHPGEMAALTGLEAGAVQANRIGAAERFAAEWGCIVVLKGAYTVVAAPAGRTLVVPVSTPALARAGTGDVLAGFITGLLAQGMAPFEAAAAGAFIHAHAGLKAAAAVGDPAAVLASDVVAAIPRVISDLRRL